MLFSISNWGNVVPVIKETFIRFPLSVIATLVTTVIGLLMIHDIEIISSDFIGKCLLASIYSTIALTSLKLLSESNSWPIHKHAIGCLAVIFIIIGYVWELFGETGEETYAFFSLAVALSLLFAPYTRNKSEPSSVWYFNYQTGVAVFFAGFAALILGAGISLSLLSIGYLFEINIPDKAYGDTWLICGGILFPIYILSNISSKFDFEEESCQFPKGIKFIANYILAPIMLVYMLILYAYFFKIIVQWELPRGNLGWMITTFGSIGIVTKLLAYPIRGTGTRLLVLFDRYYYHALIVPIILLAIAIGVRISDYGITEPRYAVALLGIWFSLVIMMAIIKKDRFHIKYLPIILAVLALVGSVGPWGAVEVSTASQVGRFKSLLLKHNLLANDVAVKTQDAISFAERKTLSGVADYLVNNDQRLARIKPWFNTLLEQSGEKQVILDEGYDGQIVMQLLGLDYVSRWQDEDGSNYFAYSDHFNLSSTMADVSEFDYVGTEYLSQYNNETVENKFDVYRKGVPDEITIEFDGSLFIVKSENGDRIKFDLAQLIQNLQNQGIEEILTADLDKVTLTRISENSEFNARLLLELIEGSIDQENKIDIDELRYILMLKFND